MIISCRRLNNLYVIPVKSYFHHRIMKVIHHIIYPALAVLLFLIGHILIISLELGMELNLLFIVGSMILCQLLVYFIAGKGFLVERFAFRQIFQILAITQFFSIAFLPIQCI